MKRITAALVLMVALVACASEQTPPSIAPDHGFGPKISLDVKVISLTDRTGLQPPNSLYSSNHFSPTISEAVKQWATDRLQANGQSGQTYIIIKNATLSAQALPLKTGFESWFTRQQSVKYVGHAEVSIETNGHTGFATTQASATRAVSLPEDPTPGEKQDAYYTLLNELMKDLGENLETGIHEHMATFITTGPVFGNTAVPIGNALATAPAAAPAAMAPAVQQPIAPAAAPVLVPQAPVAPQPQAARPAAAPSIELVPSDDDK
jgi:hypothetical protein